MPYLRSALRGSRDKLSSCRDEGRRSASHGDLLFVGRKDRAGQGRAKESERARGRAQYSNISFAVGARSRPSPSRRYRCPLFRGQVSLGADPSRLVCNRPVKSASPNIALGILISRLLRPGLRLGALPEASQIGRERRRRRGNAVQIRPYLLQVGSLRSERKARPGIPLNCEIWDEGVLLILDITAR